MFGTKWPSMISMWSQSAPASWMMREHSEKSLPKSEARIEGAIIGLGAILREFFLRIWISSNWVRLFNRGSCRWWVGGVLFSLKESSGWACYPVDMTSGNDISR